MLFVWDSDPIAFLQWPAMLATGVGAWLVGARQPWQRMVGFWTFLASNVLWGVWGWHADAYALVLLQVILAALNVRGVLANERQETGGMRRNGGERLGPALRVVPSRAGHRAAPARRSRRETASARAARLWQQQQSS